jgi:hypothetical protein
MEHPNKPLQRCHGPGPEVMGRQTAAKLMQDFSHPYLSGST